MKLTDTGGEPIRASHAAVRRTLRNPVAVHADGPEDYALCFHEESQASINLEHDTVSVWIGDDIHLTPRQVLPPLSYHGGFTMLVLSRKLGESITIGDKITVRVVAIHGNRVKLGIEAPREIPVVREELGEKPQ